MDTITIITTHGTATVEGTHWARDDNGDGDLHVYKSDDVWDGESDKSVATVATEHFVGVVEGNTVSELSE